LYILLITILIVAGPLSALAAAANTITIRNKSGSIRTNYPLQFGRPFVPGEIPNYPQVKINGLPTRTQADVKNRWPDGSVKYAVMATMIPMMAVNASIALTFQDQSVGNNAPLTAEQMLDLAYNFDAVIRITDSASGKTASASARQMLADGACKPWTQGPIAQTMICADRSAARKYDIGFSDWRALHPEFIVTFWPATKQVSIRSVGEISNSQAIEAFAYDLKLTKGNANPETVYAQAGIKHSIATRWTRGPYC
jgi:hypothetical protein